MLTDRVVKRRGRGSVIVVPTLTLLRDQQGHDGSEQYEQGLMDMARGDSYLCQAFATHPATLALLI